MSDKPLMGIVVYTHGKDYCIPKFMEMYEACCDGLVEPLMIADRDWPEFETIVTPCPGPFSEDMLIVARDLIRKEAIKRKSPACIWQGIDCYYQNREDFQRLIDQVLANNLDAVGGLTAARGDVSYAVSRYFVQKDGEYTEEQENWSDEFIQKCIEHKWLFAAQGFAGADAFVFHPRVYKYDWEGHIPWYERVNRGMPNICAEELWMLKLVRDGYTIWQDCGVLTWHAHDVDLIARLYPSTEKPISELKW